MTKTLYLIRHGFSLHNELYHKIGVDAFRRKEVVDAPLTFLGQQQSIELGQQWKEKHKVDLVLVSPLKRTLETAVNIFGDTKTPIICLEFLREYPIGKDTCNQRSSIFQMKDEFPQIDFESIMYDKDMYWTEEAETLDGLKDRIKQMKLYIKDRSETNIAIVGHSSYLGQFKDNHISYMENGESDLKHCHPYEYTFR